MPAHVPPPAPNTEYILYVGTYERGVYAFRFHTGNGKLEQLGLKGEAPSPSWIRLSADGKTLFAVSEFEGNTEGQVHSFAVNAGDGELKLLSTQPSGGVAPCHLALGADGKLLMVANYTKGGLTVYPVKADGGLGPRSGQFPGGGNGPNKARQEGPHTHQTVLAQDGEHAFVPDLGADRIRRFQIQSGAVRSMDSVAVHAGNGPRHMVFGPGDRFAYVLNELKTSVSAYSVSTSYDFTEIQTAPNLIGDSEVEGGAELLIDARGKHLYATNRDVSGTSNGSVTVFDIDGATGKLTRAQVINTSGHIPRGAILDPTGRYLLIGDQKLNAVEVFTIAPETGQLSPGGVRYSVPSPVAFAFLE